MFPRLVLAIALGLSAFSLQAASPLRLREIGVSRFVERSPGQVWLERGLLNALGGFRLSDESPVLSSVTVPPDARDKFLIGLEAWFAYQRLGPEAVINFVADEDSVPFTIGARSYLRIGVSADPKLSDGELVNISTRGWASETDKLIGGFVVDEQHRWVLLRAVGPGLAAMGVSNAMSDPYLTLYKGRTATAYNGDWGTRYNADEIAATTARVGAFPLANGSKDAALLLELSPGAYTVHVEPESGAAGAVLLEVYRVPAP